MNLCLVVMQPTFLPWAGYFNLMAQSDDFVFLDDVQLEKQSWQTRNRLVIGGQAHWIIVPVRNTHLAQTIGETEVLDTKHWRKKLARSFEQNYGRHDHFDAASEIIDAILTSPVTYLAELNESVIALIAARLKITPRIHRASKTGIQALRSARLAALCEMFGANVYLSPIGSAQYLDEDGFVDSSSATLRLQEYLPQPYLQKGTADFLSHLSILDVIANLGWTGAREYVLKGHV